MIGKTLEALQAGKELSNPATWKNRAATFNLVVVVLSALCYFVGLFWGITVPQDIIIGLAEIITIVLGLVNAYFMMATSRKVGLSPKVGP